MKETQTNNRRPKELACHNGDQKKQYTAYDCPHTTEEKGKPTRNEKRRARSTRGYGGRLTFVVTVIEE